MTIPTAEILCLGNELLIGRTINKNASDISRALTKMGLKVTRETTIRDELESASQALIEIINREPEVICISGGLGPTHDDIQLDVVAKALNRTISLNQQALDMIQGKYKVMNESRRKMALLPEGGIPLRNSEGSAPGVYTTNGRSHIFSLPGVPREMKAIFSEEVLPLINQKITINNKLIEFGCEIRGARESDIAAITNKIRGKFDGVNFKSHPKKDEEGYYLALHTYSVDADEESVKSALEEWREMIAVQFEIEGDEIKPVFHSAFDGDN